MMMVASLERIRSPSERQHSNSRQRRFSSIDAIRTQEQDGKELCDLLVKLFRVAIEGLHSAKTAVMEQE
jgi:hypothetical protein